MECLSRIGGGFVPFNAPIFALHWKFHKASYFRSKEKNLHRFTRKIIKSVLKPLFSGGRDILSLIIAESSSKIFNGKINFQYNSLQIPWYRPSSEWRKFVRPYSYCKGLHGPTPRKQSLYLGVIRLAPRRKSQLRAGH